MAETEPCILTNMCMIRDGSRILVLRRRDPHWPGVTFPGGHVEPQESFVDSVIREVWEETGLHISRVRLCGVKQFSPEQASYRYIVFFYETDTFEGTLQSSEEGEVFWIERETLDAYPLADGFREMLAVFEDDSLSENYCVQKDGRWQSFNR